MSIAMEKITDKLGRFSGLIATIIAVGSLVWFQAKTEAKVEQLEPRMQRVEQVGSEALRAHMAADEKEVSDRKMADEKESAAQRERYNTLERQIMAVKADNAERIGNITRLLEKLTEQNSQLISLIRAQQQTQKP